MSIQQDIERLQRQKTTANYAVDVERRYLAFLSENDFQGIKPVQSRLRLVHRRDHLSQINKQIDSLTTK